MNLSEKYFDQEGNTYKVFDQEENVYKIIGVGRHWMLGEETVILQNERTEDFFCIGQIMFEKIFKLEQ